MRTNHCLSQQHSISHVLDYCSFITTLIETNTVTHLCTPSTHTRSHIQHRTPDTPQPHYATPHTQTHTNSHAHTLPHTVVPSITPISSATLFATLVAATRRGCVHAIIFVPVASGGVVHPDSYRY